MLVFIGCYASSKQKSPIKPVVITSPVGDDPDDSAIWIHPEDVSKSLVLGTDKGGRLFVYNLSGKVVHKCEDMVRLNNVDVEYGVVLADQEVDIAVATDRGADRIYIFRLPDMASLDGDEGIPVFVDDPRGLFVAMSDDRTFHLYDWREIEHCIQ